MNDNAPPLTLLESRLVYENPWITLQEDRVIHRSGKPGVFGIVTMKDGVTVLPVSEENEVYLVREYKYGLGHDSLELVSGGIDEDEDPLTAAQRELEEEIGLRAREWTYLGYVDPFTNLIRAKNHMLLARQLADASTRPDATEVIESVRLPFAEALGMAIDGKITHSASCYLLLKAGLHLGQVMPPPSLGVT